jgi:hypothetical protein
MNSKLTRYKQLLNKLSRANCIHFFFFVLLISFISCKKEEDKVPPIVNIDTPERNDNVDGGFGFILKGSIVDNENIKEMQIRLEPESPNNNSTYYRKILINKSTYDFNEEVLIVNEDFISGYYNLSVTAYDGTNTGIAGVRIFVEFESIKFLGCLSTIATNTQTIVNWFNPFDGTDSIYGSAPVSFGGLAVNSKRQLYVIAEKDQRTISGRLKKKNEVIWSVSSSNTISPYQYKSLTTLDNLIYALCYNSQIEVFNRDGARQSIIYTFQRPLMITKTSNRIYTLEQGVTGVNYLGIYNFNGGQLNVIQLNFVPVGVEGQESGDVYVLGNTNGVGKLMEYKSKASAFNELKTFNYEVSSSTYCDGRLYFNSTTGALYEFSIGFNNGVQRASGVYADLMKCHTPTGQIYYNHISQGELGLFDAKSNTKITQRNYGSKVLGIEFLYSR